MCIFNYRYAFLNVISYINDNATTIAFGVPMPIFPIIVKTMES